MTKPPVLPEPTAVDSEAGSVEVVWEGTAEQGLAWMMAAGPPLSPGMAELREDFLKGAESYADCLERAARQVGLLPWIRGHLAEARRQVAWVRDAGADDPADRLAAFREGRRWRSIGDAGLLAAIDRSQEVLSAAMRFLEARARAALAVLHLAARAFAITARLCLRAQRRPPVELRTLSPEVDRGPPARRLAFIGLINRPGRLGPAALPPTSASCVHALAAGCSATGGDARSDGPLNAEWPSASAKTERPFELSKALTRENPVTGPHKERDPCGSLTAPTIPG